MGLLLFACLLIGISLITLKPRGEEPPGFSLPTQSHPAAAGEESRQEVRAVVPVYDFLLQAVGNLDGASCLEIPTDDGKVRTIQTGLDEDFQRWALMRLNASRALAGTAVALDAFSGRIVALATYNQDPLSPLAFFWKTYPAASIFKIVTASAALDMGLLEPDSVLTFNGGPYILCRRNLSQKTFSWSERVTLSEAFARSLNPVFGKIGMYMLGKEPLERYASAFFFNQELPSEVPFETARLSVPANPFGIAEIASGFNRTTTLSPIQAAWMGAALFADGAAPAPWLVETIREEPDRTIYVHREEIPVRVTSPEVARSMRELMEDTIHRGTCRRSFAPAARYRHLQPVRFGGKTGNINDDSGRVKYDWFVGYGEDASTERCLVLCVMMIHDGQRLGQRANRIAFDLFNQYFRADRAP